jgi:SAM-dependent methyltransferase
VDKSALMIEKVWAGRPGTHDAAICGDWRSMPLGPLSVDLVLGDGSLSNLRYPDEYRMVFRELRRVLRPSGRCVLRCFMQLDERETIEDVIADLNAGLIGSFHALKWRLVMALQPNLEQGVAVEAVWQLVNEKWPDLTQLAQKLRCPVEQVSTIRAYQDVATRYTFPTFSQYCGFFRANSFSVVAIAKHRYELGERCPTFVLEKQAGEAITS